MYLCGKKTCKKDEHGLSWRISNKKQNFTEAIKQMYNNKKMNVCERALKGYECKVGIFGQHD